MFYKLYSTWFALTNHADENGEIVAVNLKSHEMSGIQSTGRWQQKKKITTSTHHQVI